MKNIYDEIGRVSKKRHSKIYGLTAPLASFFGIDRFWRGMHGNDGSYAVLGNNPPVADSFFGQGLYLGHPYFRNPKFFQSGYVLPETFHSEEYEKTQGRLKKERECHHVFLYIQKKEYGFIEYGFAASQFRAGFEGVYLNHLHAIKRFIDFFEQNGARLVLESEESRIYLPSLIGATYYERPKLFSPTIASEKELQFLAAIEGKNHSALSSLTRSERAILRDYLSGSTAREIAKKIYRSPRTVEMHLENAKAKLSVRSRAELFHLLMPFQSVL